MKFLINKNESGWSLSPTSGPFEGEVVATADGVSMKGVAFAGKKLFGTVKAVWGATILLDEVFSSMHTLRGLALGHRFDMGGEPLVIDYDGFMDKANRLCKTAQRVTLIGDAVYAKGAV